MNSISLAAICGTTLLSPAAKRWQQLVTGSRTALAFLAGAFQGGAMAAVALVPVTTDRMVTDHYPIRLGPSSCRPPV
jgi:hypothetical protein